MSEHNQFKSLVDVLQARADSEHTITFIEGHDKHQSVSFEQMLLRARQRLASFQAAGLASGHFMIIQSNDNALFLEGFWACLLGGIVAVPVAGGNTREHRLKLFRIAKTLDNPALFTDEKNLQRVQQFADESGLVSEFDALRSRTCLIENNAAEPGNAVIAAPDENDPAFIQFSSGSTSTPKGIVLTHRNLVTNTGSIIDGCEMTAADHLLSWMPLTHDMGLIGFHLTPLVCGTSHSLIPTDVFVRRPSIWLTEAQRMQASILCSPNFGFQHLLKSFKVDKHRDLDLSSVRLVFNGAEPISVALCEEFMQTMGAFSLHADAMMPVYGLAEASLAVTFPRLDKRFTTLSLDRSSLALGDKLSVVPAGSEGVQFVSVGKPVSQVQVSIKDEHGADCAEHVTGRICIKGPNVTSGYYREPELNASMIDSQGWLDTGDLGFMHEEQLFITGRAKDIIFINGQNVYPHDLEEILVQAQLVERGKLAVASVKSADDREEKLLVFALHRTDIAELAPLAREITRILGEQAGLRVDAVVAVPRIPKTTSGKVQRFHLVNGFTQGEFEMLQQHGSGHLLMSGDESAPARPDDEASTGKSDEQDSSVPSDPSAQTTAMRLLTICNTHVEGMSVALEDNLFELGISSLTLAEIHASIEDGWPAQVEITDLFDYPTVVELAAFLDSKA